MKIPAALLVMLFGATVALAQRADLKIQIDASTGEGAIVLPEEATVYANPTGDLVLTKLRAGSAVHGSMGFLGAGIGADRYQFEEKGGRVHVGYLSKGDSGRPRNGWMYPWDLARFRYSSGCNDGAPFVWGFSMRWNSCFRQARDAKLDELAVSAKNDPGQ